MEAEEQEKGQERQDPSGCQDAPRCEHCGSPTHEDVVAAALWKESRLIAIEDIPAQVCEGCGEQFYGEETTHRIERVLGDPGVRPKRIIVVPVLSLSEIDVPRQGSPAEMLDEEETEAIESTFAGTERAGQGGTGNLETPEAFRCSFCGGDTCEQIVRSALWGDQGLVAVEDIPARVCQQCREQFYDEETTQRLATLAEHSSSSAEAKRKISAPVFSLAEVEVSKPSSHPPKGADP